MQRLSGIATLTRAYVDVLDGLDCQVLDTRKTCPGWRVLEKYAVRCGGGVNHRKGLYDQIMIKDNHLAVCAGAGRPIPIAIQRAREKYPDLKVEVEVDTLKLADAALKQGVAFNPGPQWSVDPDAGKNHLRICFANPSEQELRDGVAKLAQICFEETGIPPHSANVSRFTGR